MLIYFTFGIANDSKCLMNMVKLGNEIRLI